VPLVAVAGTVTVSDVDVALVTLAVTPLNLTMLLAAVALKLVPVMVTVDPKAPEVGMKPVIERAGVKPAGALRVNVPPLSNDPPQRLALVYVPDICVPETLDVKLMVIVQVKYDAFITPLNEVPDTLALMLSML
jgi:hypothetical protein